MTLKEKIAKRQSGILLYGLTPPKIKHTKDEIDAIAHKHMERIKPLDIDGLVLYDIQDEADRTDAKRPFPFIKTLEPSYYANNFLAPLNLPVIAYKAVGKYTNDELKNWLEQADDEALSVFVGAASTSQKVKTTMQEAYQLKSRTNSKVCLGGIMIPERHMKKQDEYLRVFRKHDYGCEFFISQCVYNVAAAKKFLDDYSEYAKEHNKPLLPIIFTITPCGSLKTLEFMKWLGISIPKALEEKLKHSGDILQDSVVLCKEMFQELYMYGKQKDIPVGCNVESVAIRKEEIEASIKLVHEIKDLMG